MKTFEELGVASDITKALKENNIVHPSEIQEKAIPFLIEKGTDFIGQAQTGTGKTAAFGLPLLHKINTKSPHIQALVLSPTRELCQQIAKQLFRFTKYKEEKLFVEAVYGGAPIGIQIARLRRPTHIVVATPGRLVELVEKKEVDLSRVKTVVLDEADEMLSMGFKEDMDKILGMLHKKEATWLFSATMPSGIKALIQEYMSPHPYKVEINKQQVVNRDIEHRFVVCEKDQKLDALIAFLRREERPRGVIFCRTKMNAQTLMDQLKEKNFDVEALHGDLKQVERDKVMRAFKNSKVQLLVATDIAARGIDVKDVDFVIHYELPDQDDYYTHRSGRTARAGNRGLALAIITPAEKQQLQTLAKKLRIPLSEWK